MPLRGLDVAHYQGAAVPWRSLKVAHQLSFAIAKATEGEGYVDPAFSANWRNIDAAGLVRGAYSFARPDNRADDDADAFLNVVNPSRSTDLLILDLESTTLSGPATAAWACAWADRVKAQAPGYRPGIYCGGYMHVTAYAALRSHFAFWWYPRYPSAYAHVAVWPRTYDPTLPSPDVWGGPPQFWQFSESFPAGQDYDADVFNGDLAALHALNGVHVESKPAPPLVVPLPSSGEEADMLLVRITDGGAHTPVYLVGPGTVGGVPVQIKSTADEGAYLAAGVKEVRLTAAAAHAYHGTPLA